MANILFKYVDKGLHINNHPKVSVTWTKNIYVVAHDIISLCDATTDICWHITPIIQSLYISDNITCAPEYRRSTKCLWLAKASHQVSLPVCYTLSLQWIIRNWPVSCQCHCLLFRCTSQQRCIYVNASNEVSHSTLWNLIWWCSHVLYV